MKKSVLFSSCIFLISLVSAYGSYSNLSLTDLFRSFEMQDVMLLGFLFIIWAVTSYPLGKFFPSNIAKGIAGIIAILATWGLAQSNFDLYINLSDLFFRIGLPEDVVFWIIPILVIALLGFMIYKITLSGTLMLSGFALFFLSFTDLFYEKGAAALIGIILFIAGIIVMKIKQKIGLGGKKWSLILIGFGIISWILGFATDQIPTGGFIGSLMIFIGLLGVIGKDRVEQS